MAAAVARFALDYGYAPTHQNGPQNSTYRLREIMKGDAWTLSTQPPSDDPWDDQVDLEVDEEAQELGAVILATARLARWGVGLEHLAQHVDALGVDVLRPLAS